MSQHREFSCCWKGCMGIICLTPEQEQKCPMGHAQGFYGDTDEEKEIKRLKNIIAARERSILHKDSQINGLRAEILSLRARLGHRTRRLKAAA